jgi:hypothetical protein
MEKIIYSILSSDLNFEFSKSNSEPIKHLKNESINIPNDSGIYMVFCLEDLNKEDSHLKFEFNERRLTLVYFGKAGGYTKTGRKLSQGLNGRINNVVSNDVKRAIYWKKEMEANNLSKYLVYCLLDENPTIIENQIYDFLDRNSLSYPLMNKKRGKKPKGK